MPVRYSQRYERSDTLTRDSQRFRNRLERLMQTRFPERSSVNLARLIERECGIDVVSGQMHAYANWRSLFRGGELRDIFDTLYFAFVSLRNSANLQGRFLEEASRIFDEEAVGFFLDHHAVVHPRVDEAFEVSRQSIISGLSGARYSAAISHLQAVDNALLSNPCDGRSAIRSVFDVVENIYKQKFPRETHVNRRSLVNCLRPYVETTYAESAQELRVALKLYENFCGWIDAVHFYRHEAGSPEPSQPTETMTHLLISHGYSYARWLIDIFDE